MARRGRTREGDSNWFFLDKRSVEAHFLLRCDMFTNNSLCCFDILRVEEDKKKKTPQTSCGWKLRRRRANSLARLPGKRMQASANSFSAQCIAQKNRFREDILRLAVEERECKRLHARRRVLLQRTEHRIRQEILRLAAEERGDPGEAAPEAAKKAPKATPKASIERKSSEALAKSSEIKSTQDLLDEFAESKDYASRSIEIGNLVHWHSHLTRAIIDIDVQVKRDSMQASNGWQPAYNCMARALSPEEITKLLAVMAELEHNPNDICMEHKDVWMHSRLHVPSRVASLRAKIKAGETIYGVFDSNHRLAGMLLLAENVSAPTFTLQRRFLVCPYLATTPLVLTTAMSMLLNKAHALGRTPSFTDSLYHYYQVGLRLQAAQHGRNFTLSATRIIAELTAAGVQHRIVENETELLKMRRTFPSFMYS